jgi:hypothetical protein
MSLEYYLLCREKYEHILKYLEGIEKLYDEMIEITSNCSFDEMSYNIFLHDHNKKIFANKKEDVYKLKILCDNNIYKLCNHEYIHDSIDITPEKSENITYCAICGFTK